MKDFLKYVLATMIGLIAATAVITLLAFALIVGLVATISDDEATKVKNNTVLLLNLDQPIKERTPDDTFSKLPVLGSDEAEGIGFADIIKSLKAAKKDDKIKAVYLNVSSPSTGMSTMKEVRDAIIDFRKSKKPVIAYSEVYSQSAYYLASAADKIYLNPQGALEFKGFNAQLAFFKGALDKLGVEAQIIRVGNYKSAVEPFINTKMSDYNRQQVSVYINGMYQIFLEGIADSRKITVDSLKQIANHYKIQLPADAVTYKMVDALKYKDEVLEELRQLTKQAAGKTITSITVNEYVKTVEPDKNKDGKIAVIYANGDIVGGEGSDNQIGSERISRAIRRARFNKDIKAIVLRVNSGGGSALASEVIWREMILSKKVKPVMASFGDVAASGGYYIACAADSIFVQPNTITGSIGVFGVIPNFQNLLNNKLGITFDGVKTGEYADIMTTTRPMTPSERFIVQNSVNHIYNSFIARVANGRKKTMQQVDAIGGGRVWTGNDAVKIGLADRTASFEQAILAAAKKAKLKNFEIVEYPEKIDPIKALFKGSEDKVSAFFAKKELGENYVLYQSIQKIIKQTAGVQAKMDYQINID